MSAANHEVLLRRQLLLGLGLSPLLSACVSVGGGDAPLQALYRLHDEGAGTAERLPAPLVAALLIQQLPANAMADTVSMAYSKRAHEFAFYQQGSWVEQPVRQVPRLLQQRLEARGIAGAVGLLGDPMRADWLLTVGISSLHHEVGSEPGSAKLALTLELFDRRSRQRVARRRFDAEVPARSASAAGAAQALSQALSQSFDALLPWLETELARAAKVSPPAAPAPAG
ncbi:ABC-type transport auxiliary lipoprotein family protein [Roseateles cavernae]|uniref:ABC-type transport auxiliary lipoprotein family protein n=1 Tax=Roseateles cavernae TaxID=3153578 RepID=UPI0032E4AAA8